MNAPLKAQLPSSRLLDTRTAQLDNGLRVVAVLTPHLAVSYVGLLIGVGSRHEAPKQNGVSHFLEHMVFRGTEHYADARDLNIAAEGIGGALDAATSRDHTSYSTTCHPTRLHEALELLSEVLLRSKFRHLKTEREIVREEMRESLNDKGEVIDPDTLAHALLYGEHGLSQSIEGSSQNLDTFSQAVLRKHQKAHYTANNSVLVMAGPIDWPRALKSVKATFSDMPVGKLRSFSSPQPITKSQFCWVNDPGSQVDLRINFPTFSAQDPDYPALNMLSRVLTDGLSSRLHAELIDKKGLAYSLSAGPESFTDCGSFDFDATVAPNKAVRALDELLKFTQQAVKAPPTKVELERVKQRHMFGIDFMRDAPGDLALWFGRGWLLGGELDFDVASEKILRVSPEDCARVAKRIFDRCPRVVVGVGHLPKDEVKQLRALALG